MEGRDLVRAVRRGKEILEANGRTCDVSPNELRRYFEAEIPHPDLPLEAVLLNDLLVVHELVEIYELKQRGLRLTKNVILEHPEDVFEAHLAAAELELQLAREGAAWQHIRSRLPDIQSWCENSLLSPRLRKRCAQLLLQAEGALSAGRPDRG